METKHRPLSAIAADIRKHWTPAHNGALPYLFAMGQLTLLTDDYVSESARSIVVHFLSNADTWTGPTAKRIKKELDTYLRLDPRGNPNG